MAAISGVSEQDMTALIVLLEESGIDAGAVQAILDQSSGIVRHELSLFMLRLGRHSTREGAWAEIHTGPWADWPGVTG